MSYNSGEWVWVWYGGEWHKGTVEHVHGADAYTLKFSNRAGQQRLFVTNEPQRIRPYRSEVAHAYDRRVA